MCRGERAQHRCQAGWPGPQLVGGGAIGVEVELPPPTMLELTGGVMSVLCA